jgi:hypothetical protein
VKCRKRAGRENQSKEEGHPGAEAIDRQINGL